MRVCNRRHDAAFRPRGARRATYRRNRFEGDDIGGIAVNIAARVAAMAGPGETLVSSTVRDLVAGSGLRFEDRGHHTLKGLPEAVHLYTALGVG